MNNRSCNAAESIMCFRSEMAKQVLTGFKKLSKSSKFKIMISWIGWWVQISFDESGEAIQYVVPMFL